MLVFIQYIVLFVSLVLTQVLVLNNIQFLGFLNPYIYVLFILSLPVKFPRWATLLLAFGLGITIDAFANTLGMHAFATVLMAYVMPFITKLIINIEEGSNPMPSFRTFGLAVYVKYVFLLVFIHHITLFLLESFGFNNFGLLLLKITLSSAVSIIIILGIQSFKKR